MVSGNQQILGYFIEEAKEHLETIEQGLSDLQSTMKDAESMNEMFRAAHSVKGGAAMLGFGSIQKTAHRLEDGFKVLKESQNIKIDQKLESLFFKCFDTMRDLLDRLQGPFGLRDEEANQVMLEAEPIFGQLQAYLESLTGGGGEAPSASEKQQIKADPAPPKPDFVAQVTAVLRQMLQLFKEKANPANRQQLEQLCNSLLNLGEDTESWQNLVQTAQTAIANPNCPYVTLAPLVIGELKQASEQLKAGKASQIAPSKNLQRIADNSPSKRIILVVEPKAAAETLVKTFNKKQLSQLMKALQTTAKTAAK
ncbi:MAG: Hpt domain-containing protein [Hormoscilla sp.]